MKKITFCLIVFIFSNYYSYANKNFDLFLIAPKFIGITHTRNFEDEYNYMEINAGVGDLKLHNHYDNTYEWIKSHYFQPGLGLKFEDSGKVTPYLSIRVADVEKISNVPLGPGFLVKIGSEVLCYARTLDFYEDTKWLVFKTGIGYLFLNEYPASLRAMITGKIGYSTLKLDTAINREFTPYARNEFKNLDLLLGFDIKFEYKPVNINFDFNMRSVLDKRSFSHVSIGTEISYIDYLTANIKKENTYSLLDFANFNFFLNCIYESIFVEGAGARKLNIGAGFYYYFNNREPVQSYEEANP